jgi:hypothetical protein
MCVNVLVLSPYNGFSFWVDVHKELSKNAISTKQQNIDLSIIGAGLINGIDEVVKNKSLRDWIIEGSEREDDDMSRYRKHFYNPLDERGLNDVFTDISSYEWATHPSNKWSWRSAREKFHLGMTAKTDQERRAALADSFRALGQVMHLLQDKAVPAHVRNDMHMIPDGFEAYTNKNVNTLNTLNFNPKEFKGPKTSISTYVPRQLWTSGQFDGTNPSTSTAIGLAEYTNANFASEDTLFTENNLADWNQLNDKHYFPYPRLADTVVFAESQNKVWNGFDVYRKYFEKTGGGEKIKHFATASRLYAYLLDDPIPGPQGFDDKVHKDYADLLIPRAVGYSAALLDYFFRGKIDMVPDPGNAGQYVIKNESDEDMSGTFSLYYDDDNGIRRFVPGATWAVVVSTHDSSNPVTFTAPSNMKVTGKYVLVFSGRLGQEDGASVGRIVELASDQPRYVVVGINAIWGSRPAEVWYTVWDLKTNAVAEIFDDKGKKILLPCFGPEMSSWLERNQAVNTQRVYVAGVNNYQQISTSDWSLSGQGNPENFGEQFGYVGKLLPDIDLVNTRTTLVNVNGCGNQSIYNRLYLYQDNDLHYYTYWYNESTSVQRSVASSYLSWIRSFDSFGGMFDFLNYKIKTPHLYNEPACSYVLSTQNNGWEASWPAKYNTSPYGDVITIGEEFFNFFPSTIKYTIKTPIGFFPEVILADYRWDMNFGRVDFNYEEISANKYGSKLIFAQHESAYSDNIFVQLWGLQFTKENRYVTNINSYGIPTQWNVTSRDLVHVGVVAAANMADGQAFDPTTQQRNAGFENAVQDLMEYTRDWQEANERILPQEPVFGKFQVSLR